MRATATATWCSRPARLGSGADLTSDSALGAAEQSLDPRQKSFFDLGEHAWRLKGGLRVCFIQPSPPIAWYCWMAARAKRSASSTPMATAGGGPSSIGEAGLWSRPAPDWRKNPGAERRADLQRPHDGEQKGPGGHGRWPASACKAPSWRRRKPQGLFSVRGAGFSSGPCSASTGRPAAR